MRQAASPRSWPTSDIRPCPQIDYDPELDPSRIWYREGFSAEATVLLEMLPGALVEPLPDEDLVPGSDVVVVLGVGYEE